jgi:hypothetical protein
MHLDVQTLSVVTVFITALLGALLVFAGLQNRNIRAPMWWGAAHIVNACGLGLLSSQGAAPGFVTNDLANALVLLGYGPTRTGARIFDGRNTRPLFVLFAPVFWLALCRIPGFAASASLGTIVVSTLLAVLALLAAEEFWRGRDEALMSRWPTVVVLLLAYAAVLLARVPATLLAQSFGDNSLLSGLSFALLSFGALLFTVVMAFLQLNMIKERTELKHKINSLIDPLSGVANRRAFLDGAAGLLAQQETDHEPLAVLLFDLDASAPSNWRRASASASRSVAIHMRASPIFSPSSIARSTGPRNWGAIGSRRKFRRTARSKWALPRSCRSSDQIAPPSPRLGSAGVGALRPEPLPRSTGTGRADRIAQRKMFQP